MPDRFQRSLDDLNFYDKEEYKDYNSVGGILVFYIVFIAVVAIGMYAVINLAMVDIRAGYTISTFFDKWYIPLAWTVIIAGAASVLFLFLKNKLFFFFFGITALTSIVFEGFIKQFSYFSLIDKKDPVPQFDLVSGAWESIFMILVYCVWLVYFLSSTRVKNLFSLKKDT